MNEGCTDIAQGMVDTDSVSRDEDAMIGSPISSPGITVTLGGVDIVLRYLSVLSEPGT